MTRVEPEAYAVRFGEVVDGVRQSFELPVPALTRVRSCCSIIHFFLVYFGGSCPEDGVSSLQVLVDDGTSSTESTVYREPYPVSYCIPLGRTLYPVCDRTVAILSMIPTRSVGVSSVIRHGLVPPYSLLLFPTTSRR